MALLCLLFGTVSLEANPFYVSPAGNDSNPGTQAAPFRTIERARTAARAATVGQSADVVVFLRGGRYELANPLQFDANDSGRNGFRVIYRAFPNETPVISGGRRVINWTHHRDGIYRASAPVSNFRQLYVDGRRATRARTPNTGFHRVSSWSDDRTIRIPGSTIQDWNNMSQVELVVMKHWNQSRFRIGSYHRSGDTAIVVPQEPERSVEWLVQWPNREPHQAFYFENSFSFLDTPGEWYLDRSQQAIFYMPRAGENIHLVEVIAPRLERLLEIRGSSNLQFIGLNFEHSNWTAPSEEGFIGIQAGSYRVLTTGALIPSAVYLESTQDVRFERNAFRNLGTSGLELAFGTLRTNVIGNAFADIAGNGVSVYTLLSNRNPADHLRCRNDVVRNNYITRVAQDYTGAVGIFASYPRGLIVENNELTNMPYTAINVGWGWTNLDTGTRDIRVRYNRIHGVMNLMDDGAGIYTLSKQENTLIEENHISHMVRNPWAGTYEIAALYLDEQSEGITMRNNVVQHLSGVMVWKQNRANSNTVFNNGDGIPNQQAIINAAGLQTAFHDIRGRVDRALPSGIAPFGGNPAPVPGRIQAEDFDHGGQGVSYHDVSGHNQGGQYRRAENVDIETCQDIGGGHNVGWTEPGEWLQYTVAVATTGTYDLRFRIATPQSGRTFSLLVDGEDVTGTITSPNTGGWQQWQTLVVPDVFLQSGQRRLRLRMGTGGMNFNWFETELKSVPQPVTVGITAPSTGEKIQAETETILSAAVSPNDGSVVRVEFFTGATKIGERTAAPFSLVWTPQQPGAVALTARATRDTGEQVTSPAVEVEVVAKPVERTPFRGSPALIPGRILAVEYDHGGPGVAYHDSTSINHGGAFRPAEQVDIESSLGETFPHNIGWTEAGEWLDYSVRVVEAGHYNLRFRLATERSGSHFRVTMSGEDISGKVEVPNTGGWQNWRSVSGPTVFLEAGDHVMRVEIGFGEVNLGYVEFQTVAEQPVRFEQWRNLYFTAQELQNPVHSGPKADPDGDGVPNLLEYALYRNPRVSSRINLPQAGAIVLGGQTYLTINYTRVAVANDLTFTVETSDDMLTWTAGEQATVVVSVTPDGPVEHVVVRDALPLGQEARFLRLRVTQRP